MYQSKTDPPRYSEPLGPILLPAAGKYAYTENRQVFGMLYEYHTEPLTKRLKALVNNREIAYDLCQDTFVRMWKNYFLQPERVSNEIIEYFEPRLYTIARNLAVDYIRHANRLVFVPMPEGESDEPRAYVLSGQIRVVGHEQQVCEQLCIEQVLAAMSPQYRVCLLLQTKWGMTQREIASELGIGVKAVGTNVSRGNKQFRTIYERMMSDNCTNNKGGSERNG